jgi:hypothetical protein
MPRYYFNIVDGRRFDDAEGLELPDTAAARAEAVAIARDLMRIDPTRTDWSEWLVQVTNEHRQIAFDLLFRDAGR